MRERLYGLVGLRRAARRAQRRALGRGLFVHVPRGVEVELPDRGDPAGHRRRRPRVRPHRSWWSRRAPGHDDRPLPLPDFAGAGARVVGGGALRRPGRRAGARLGDRLGRRGAPPRAAARPGGPRRARPLGGRHPRRRRRARGADHGLRRPRIRRPGAGPLLRGRRAAFRAPRRRPARGAPVLLEPALQGRDPGSRAHGLLRQPGGAPGRARHRRLPDQPQPGAERRRPRRHDPVPRDRDGRGEVLPRRGGRPRGRRAPLLPALARASPRRPPSG